MLIILKVEHAPSEGPRTRIKYSKGFFFFVFESTLAIKKRFLFELKDLSTTLPPITCKPFAILVRKNRSCFTM